MSRATRAFRWLLVLSVLLFGAVRGVATAQVECETCTNQQDGDNEASTEQSGEARSGDAVGGQVVGAVSSGDTSIDAKNRSEDVEIETGAAEASNEASQFIGLNFAGDELNVGEADAEADDVVNQQEGDNEANLTQAATASSGDGVAGQIIGAVTSAGGSADIVADNATRDASVETGSAEAENAAALFVGLAFVDNDLTVAADVEANTVDNQQDGDNSVTGRQSAVASSGDGVAGEVLGVVSAGDASVDARNRTEDVEVTTGNVEVENEASLFVGLLHVPPFGLQIPGGELQDASAGTAVNQQDGDNSQEFEQIHDGVSGDAVAGQVAGVVTAPGGTADVVLDNATKDVEIESGETSVLSRISSFVGHAVTGALAVGSGIVASCGGP